MLFVASMLCGVGCGMAQTHFKSNVYVGAKGGATLSEIFFNPNVRQLLSPGMTAGVTVRYIEEKYFGIVAELNFSQRGWKDNFEGAPYNYQRQINYLQLPIFAHLYFGHRGKFFLNLGPEFGVMLGESTKSNFDFTQIKTLPDFPINNRVTEQFGISVKNKFDYGIAAGVGGEFFINQRNSLALEGRFYYGLGNIFSADRTDPFHASNSMSLQFTAQYWFRVK